MSTRPLTRRPLHLALGRGLRAAGSLAGGGRRPRARTLLIAATVLLLLVLGWLWLRNSSLVAVRQVEVTGVSGSRGAPIRLALEEAARSMTTLHVRRDALETAVSPYALVKRIEVETDFPHTMRIHVVTNVAVGAIVADGRRIAVSSDGTLMRDSAAPAGLPKIVAHMLPGSPRVTGGETGNAVAALAAAPPALREHVESIATTRDHGLTIQIAHGPLLWFGDAERLSAKWAAAAAVLADPEAAGASTIDVTAPERPGVGGLPEGTPTTGESDIPEPPVGEDGTVVPVTPDPSTVDPTATAPSTP